MKWSTIVSALLFSVATVCASEKSTYMKDFLIDDYQEPKNIMFASMIGGSSHVTWVLSILDELSKRGHNITYVTRGNMEKFSRPYPHFNTIVLGGETVTLEKINGNSHFDIMKLLGPMFLQSNMNFANDYKAMKTIMQDYSTDVAVCDFGSSSGCYEAAEETKTPYVVTMAFSMTQDSSAPYINNNLISIHDSTTQHMSFIDRFNDMFIKPIRLIINLRPVSKKIIERRHEAGCYIDSFEGDPRVHTKTLKLVNSLFGIEAARPMGPLVEMVGPIIPRSHDPLTPEIKTFLDAHSRIIYIAFGQHAKPSEKDLKLILTAVMEAIEYGAYDGFLFATRLEPFDFPKSIHTQSGTSYNVQEMFDGLHRDNYFIGWAPQTAIVLHPSVSVFLTHGGAGSFYEGLYAGKRLVVFPFFGDQNPNAFNVERNKLNGYLRHKATSQIASQLLVDVGADINGTYQKNVNRYKALVQIHSRHGITRGADLIEEVLFVADDEGHLPYRLEVAREMSFIKSHNIDLFAAAGAIVLLVLLIAGLTIKKVVFFSYALAVKKKEQKPKSA